MNKRLLLLIFLIIAVNVWQQWRGPSTDLRRPPPQTVPDFSWPAPSGEKLPQASPFDPEIHVKLDSKEDSVGSAFSLDARGRWVTARHVADGCSSIQLRFARHRGLNVLRVTQHPQADLAVLSATASGSSLSLANESLRVGQDGFFVGYPQGVAGEVWGILIGRMRMRISGRYQTNEPVVAWSERARFPARLTTLGGLSGGPVVEDGGDVVGIVVAESPRRGRVFTAAPASLQPLFAAVDAARGSADPSITPGNFREHADALRGSPSIAKVVCLTRRLTG